MRNTIECLIGGDRHVAPAYRSAAAMWRGLLKAAKRDPQFDLAAQARLEESAFVQACGENELGKGAMGVTAAVVLAEMLEAIEDPAARKQFEKRGVVAVARCTSEVKQAFYDAAKVYDLDLGAWRP